MNSLSDIQKGLQINAGGIKNLNMSLLEDIASIPLPVGNAVQRGIKMKNGLSFRRFYFTPDTCRFSQSFSKTVHGKEFTAKVVLSFPGSDPDTLLLFEKMMRMNFIIIPQDNNLFYRIVGSDDSPAKFSYEYDSGGELKNGAKYICTFTAKSSHSAHYYLGGFTNVIFNEGYSLGFLRTR